LRTVLRLLAIVAVAVTVSYGLSWMRHFIATTPSAGMQAAMTGVIVVSLILLMLLMAMPFVPGLEIGLSLLMLQGAAIAPFVYLATVAGLALAYLIGRFLPYDMLHRAFADLGLMSACRLLERLKPLDPQARVQLLQDNLPNRLATPLLRYRYLAVALAFNMPGNVVLGGGGGIALVAGISRLFHTRIMLFTISLAVAPLPVGIWLFGKDMVTWFGP
jgi:hypothetical protein